MILRNALVGGTCRCNIHMNGRTQSFAFGLHSSYSASGCTHLAIHAIQKKTWFWPGHHLPFPCGLVLMLTCPLLALSAVDRGSAWAPQLVCSYSAPYSVMHCVFWDFSIRTSIHLFHNLSFNISFVGSDHSEQSSLPMCISDPRPSVTLPLVHHCSFLALLLINPDHCRPGTPHKSCILELFWPSPLVVCICVCIASS